LAGRSRRCRSPVCAAGRCGESAVGCSASVRQSLGVPARDNEAMASELIRCGHCGQRNRVPAAAAGTPRCGKCHQPLPWIAEADDTTFGDVAEAAKIPVLVDLWAPWCGPCRMVSPALEQLTRDLAGRVKLVKVNVDVSPQLSQRFGAQAIPTLLVLRDGRVAARQTGAAPYGSPAGLGRQRARLSYSLSRAAPAWGAVTAPLRRGLSAPRVPGQRGRPR